MSIRWQMCLNQKERKWKIKRKRLEPSWLSGRSKCICRWDVRLARHWTKACSFLSVHLWEAVYIYWYHWVLILLLSFAACPRCIWESCAYVQERKQEQDIDLVVARKSGKIGESDARSVWHLQEKHAVAHPSTNFHDAFKNRVHSFKIESKRIK